MKRVVLLIWSFLCSTFILLMVALALHAYPELVHPLHAASIAALFGWLWLFFYRIMRVRTRSHRPGTNGPQPDGSRLR